MPLITLRSLAALCSLASAGLLPLGCTTTASVADDDDSTSSGSGSGGGTGCVLHTECGPATPVCLNGTCSALPAGHPLGWGDGSPESVALVQIYEPDAPREATDLAFHPTRPNELWMLMREYPSSASCTQAAPTEEGCVALEGSIALLTNPGTESASWRTLRDANAWHFLRRPPSIAMGVGDTFATCGEERTGNFLDDPIDFMGPTLWSSDLTIFGPHGPGGNGSHLDMLHATPLCMGIAHERDNVYWLFNGAVGALDKYDFAEPHVPGGEFHGDGSIWRFGQGQLSRVPGVPSHLEFYDADQHLYVADTGNGRIVKLDPASGTPAGEITPNYDQVEVNLVINGATLTEVVPPGTLTTPSGLAIHDGLIYVTDTGTSQLHAFDMNGTLVRSLATTLPSGSLAGLEIGPDQKLYFVDKPTARLYRVDPL